MKNTGIISEKEIRKQLKNDGIFSFTVLKSTGSTNADAKISAENGAPEWTVIIAESQTDGKGRMNRKFCSPQGSGIYMSIVLRPTFTAEESLAITTSAAVAVSKAIENLSKKQTGIKWVNDIYIADKKVCGILTEAAIDHEGLKLKYAVLGIGINVCPPPNGFPEEIKNIAGAVFENEEISDGFKEKLIAEILNEFENLYSILPDRSYMEHYRNRSILTGKEVDIIKCGTACGEGTVEDISDDFGLIIRHSDGTRETLSSGEVSVKKKV